MPRADNHRILWTELSILRYKSLVTIVLQFFWDTEKEIDEQRLLPTMMAMGEEQAACASRFGAAYLICLDGDERHQDLFIKACVALEFISDQQ